MQPRAIKTLKIPDYFAEYRDKGDGLASFLGTSIVAKVRLPRIRTLLSGSLTAVPLDNVQRDGGQELYLEGRVYEYGAEGGVGDVAGSVVVLNNVCSSQCFRFSQVVRIVVVSIGV